MDLKTWRAGEEYELPSGLIVRLRKVGILDVAVSGDLPSLLGPKIEQIAETGKFDLKDFAEFEPVVNQLVKLCVISPLIGDEPGEGVLGVKELAIGDRLALFAWANQGVGQLHKFRGEESKPVEVAQPGNGLRAKTKRNRGH